MKKDSTFSTILISFALCVICSLLVSGSVVLLKPLQEENKKLDFKKSVLKVSGIGIDGDLTKDKVDSAFKQIETRILDIEAGELLRKGEKFDLEKFDPGSIRRDPATSKSIEAALDKGNIKSRELFLRIFLVKDSPESSTINRIVLPIHGKGLWSTMFGLIAVDAKDFSIKGITFYEHGETPGLGGEIDNPIWQAKWLDKKIYDDNFQFKFSIPKASVSDSDPEAKFKVSAISGATLTSNGLRGTVEYWFGSDGLQKFLKNVKERGINL